MKKYLSFLVFFLFLILLTSCGKNIRTIKIYNCVDYINEEVLDGFKDWFQENYGEEIEVVYDTFETNESMYNTLRSGKTHYDLCCPSDYMIQKMQREGMLDPFDLENYNLDIYFENVSPYIKNIYDNNKLSDGLSWSNYAACYMWGTLGIIYNPENLGEALDEIDEDGNYYYEVTSWLDFIKPEFKGMMSLKDSVRDSYCVAQILANIDELNEHDNLDPSYNALIQDVINRRSDEDIQKAEIELRKMKPNLFGLEVDSAKGDIVTGKISMNLAWSGDAVYSIDLAEEEYIELRYIVPEEGGNVWFDGWVTPKGADQELALAFINYISQPEMAKLNMDEIGYTSPIAGDAIYELISEWYGIDSLEEGENLEDYNFVEFDLSFFFGDTLSEDYLSEGKALIQIEESYIGRQFSTQYPDEETLNRCGVMQDFEEQNEKVLQMWINFRANKAPLALIFALILFVVLCAVIALFSKKAYFERRLRAKKEKKINNQ